MAGAAPQRADCLPYLVEANCSRETPTGQNAMFSHRICYNELGDRYLDKLNKHHLTRNLIHRLERLGYTVKLEPKAA